MRINYNNWFYEFHQYLTGTRNGNVSYNDTNWVDIGKRYQTLIETSSHLLEEQPYAVVGNDIAFDKLLDLLEKSNYTFDDIDDALVKTYEATLRGAMSKMVVNTHNVVAHYKSTDTKHVYVDRFTQHYIIEVPFAQMHFGERDEFIRQKLHKMHETDTDLYLPIQEFFTNEIVDILGFTIMCTSNGFICNDCYVAMSEKGLRFKINWNHSEDADFIIYKLDECYVCEATVDINRINDTIYMRYLPDNIACHIGQKCILNIYDKNYIDTATIAPNFGELTRDGLVIHHMQPYTTRMLSQYHTQKVTIGMYFLKYLHEIPNVYPALNYYDIMDCRRVLTDKGNMVETPDGNRVLMQSTKNVNALEVCTPPICIDRPIDISFFTLTKCLDLRRALLEHHKDCIKPIVEWLQKPTNSIATIEDQVIEPAEMWYNAMYEYYVAYVKCATITSIIPNELVNRFKDLLDTMDGLRNIRNISDVDAYRENDDLYTYGQFIDDICEPFTNSRLGYFEDLGDLSKNYYVDQNSNRFNRPVSEQSFITLRYDRDDACWLFADPKIRHFHGIGNTFYINDELLGDEIFKFFVLYSDTEAPSALEIDDSFTTDLVLDFDLFSKEVNQHLGFLRYWNAENKLMKLSNILLHEYSEESTVQILSKILKRKVEGFDILDEYGSDMIYTPATMTSSNVGASDMDLQAPFAINFLFYTLAFIQDNEDKLETYFYQQLTNKKFNQRYVDLDMSSALKEHGTFPLNLSRISRAPNAIDAGAKYMNLDGNMHLYYGLPILFNNKNIRSESNAYRYTYNVYKNDVEYPCVTTGNAFDDKYSVTYDGVTSCGYQQYDFTTDVIVARYLTFYLTSLRNYINELQTNYKTSFNQTVVLQSGIEQLQKHIAELKSFVRGKAFLHEDTMKLVNGIITDNPIIALFEDMITEIHNCIYFTTFYVTRHYIQDSVNTYLDQLRRTYQQTGFDQIALKRIRKLYTQLKKINQPMSLMEYKNWWNSIDGEYMSKEVRIAVSNNPNVVQGSFDFNTYGRNFVSTRERYALPAIEKLKGLLDDLDTLKETHLAPIESHCATIINEYIFDLYAIDKVRVAGQTFHSKPAYVTITIPCDKHTVLPLTNSAGTVTLYFVPSVGGVHSSSDYTITDLRSIAEYAFFDGTKIPDSNITATAYTENGTSLGSIRISEITFCKVGSSSDTTSEFQQIPDLYNTKVDIQNMHESFTVKDNHIINQKSSVINYEMLYGNRFTTLDHHPEWIVKHETELQGPIDRLYISNHTINRMALVDYGNRNSQRVFFKPSQVLHMPIDALRRVRAFGGKNFVGQRIYLSTPDTNYIFPAKVTCIDHSQARGILEAKVESRDAKWLELKDSSLITKYLTSDITCTVLPDNIGNFLDEFSNEKYGVYFNPEYDQALDFSDPVYTDMYSLPGDPIFVQNHADFVYTRLSHFFHELVPNRFIDEEHKKWRFIYMGYRDTRHEKSTNSDTFFIMVKCLKHNFNPMTLPEMYPILREEPNDHDVWYTENKVFESEFNKSMSDISKYNTLANQYRFDLSNAKTEYDRQRIVDNLHTTQVKLKMAYARSHKLQFWTNQRENPSTWYNVYSYNAAEVYVDNGRANQSYTFIEDFRDIPWFEGLHVFIYDWESHTWVDPSTYRFDLSSTANNGIDYYSDTDNPDDFITTDVLKHVTIFPQNGFPHSKRLLIYFAYETSEFQNRDRIQLGDTCEVRFKPILSLNKDTLDDDPYAKLYVRKHFDVNETYQYSSYNAPDTFSNENAYHVIRDRRSGKHLYPPAVRLCDVSVINNGNEQPFDLYVKMPFPNVSTERTFRIPSYRVLQYKLMDDFVPNQRIKFICIQNRSNLKYDGNISNIMFEGITGDTETDPITITTSTLPSYTVGSFVCTVFMDTAYKCKGGVYSINVDANPQNLMDDNHAWIKIPNSIGQYKEIPNEFIIVPENELTGITTISLKATYDKKSTDTISVDNENFNPFEYYFDEEDEIRFPIADVRTNDHKKRLVINQRLNIKVDVIKTNYIGISRYALGNIPKDGFIDVTGYIPTPLSRDRYEFWVNGRYIKHPDDVVILSPTSFQLRNLRSLHNFELIELVEDTDDNDLVKHGSVYVATNGNVYMTYERAMLSNLNFTQQDIRYTFNGYPNHTKLQDYIGDMKVDANNRDIEVNILEGLRVDSVTSYNELWNVPSINGVSLYHVTTDHLGMQEVPYQKILNVYDKVWKREILTNPLFPMTHSDGSLIDRSFNQIYVRKSSERDGMPNVDTSDMYLIYTKGLSDRYQSLYISRSETAPISDTNNTLKIIPFVKNGTRIYVDKKYHGMWVHSTDSSYEPKIIK